MLAPLATWQDLCIDALDVSAQADFWAAVSGLERVGPIEHTRLEGPTPAHTVWVNEVDRAHVVKNRVHLDVHVAAETGIGELVARGARVLAPSAETGRRWTVMADPEGNEFCAFERAEDELSERRLHGVGVDCVDAERAAAWWAGLFGVEPVAGGDDEQGRWWSLERVAPGITLDFANVPEPRTVPNRVHWDVRADVEALLAAGASRLWDTPGWVALADPEGNEFCCFAP